MAKETIIEQLLTGADNTTYDLGRVLWAVSVISYLFFAFYVIVYNGMELEFLEYGTGLAGLLAGGGAALGFKKHSEPPAKKDDEATGE